MSLCFVFVILIKNKISKSWNYREQCICLLILNFERSFSNHTLTTISCQRSKFVFFQAETKRKGFKLLLWLSKLINVFHSYSLILSTRIIVTMSKWKVYMRLNQESRLWYKWNNQEQSLIILSIDQLRFDDRKNICRQNDSSIIDAFCKSSITQSS